MKNLIRMNSVSRKVKLVTMGLGIVTIFALNLGCSKTESNTASQNQSNQSQSTQEKPASSTEPTVQQTQPTAQLKAQPKVKTSSGSKTTVTYTSDIKPFLDKKCVGCHNPNGSVASIPLDTYANVSNEIKVGDSGNSEIIKAVDGGQMSGRLSASQIELLKKWVKQGAVK